MIAFSIFASMTLNCWMLQLIHKNTGSVKYERTAGHIVFQMNKSLRHSKSFSYDFILKPYTRRHKENVPITTKWSISFCSIHFFSRWTTPSHKPCCSSWINWRTQMISADWSPTKLMIKLQLHKKYSNIMFKGSLQAHGNTQPWSFIVV